MKAVKPGEVNLSYEVWEMLCKVRPGEPVFILRAQDKLAPQIVRLYAMDATMNGVNPTKVKSVRNVAEQMSRWQETNGHKLPD